jgi:Uroporphyrinogen decarboxylase (URO-D)
MIPSSCSAERVRASLRHQAPDAVPVDFGGTFVTGIHVSCVAALRRHFGLGDEPVRVIDPGQMLGEIGEDLKAVLRVDVEGVVSPRARFGFPLADWKPWRMPDGLEVLVPGGFQVTTDANGDILMYPQSDLTAPPSARMPKDGYFFDSIERGLPIDEDRLDPADNLEEYRPLADSDLDYFEQAVLRASGTGRAVVAGFGGTALGDIALIPGAGLKHPRGIRNIAEWYMSTRSRKDYVHRVFEGQCDLALANLARIHDRVGDRVDVVNICGTDFGTQSSSFCSVATFRELWLPYYRRINGWVHRNTGWRTFKHSCGAVSKFIPAFLEAGFDILNPVQCSAAGMDPGELKRSFGEALVFWGGGVDTQSTLPFGSPEEVRTQVLGRCEAFSAGGGFVFTTVHNIQARTPTENILAMVNAVREFSGRSRM